MAVLCRDSMAQMSVRRLTGRRDDQVFAIKPHLDAGGTGSRQGLQGAHIRRSTRGEERAGGFASLPSFRQQADFQRDFAMTQKSD